MKGAFVAGATGYTGREVVRQLITGEVETWAHVRPDSPRVAEWKERFAALGARVDTTPWEPAAMRATLSRLRPTVVFALLGTTRARGGAYEAVDYGLSSLLLEAAVASGARPRFVYLSSVGVGPGSRSRYLAVRWKLEEELRASGLEYVIARPSFITGPGREEFRAGERILSRVTDGVLAAAGLLGARRLRARYRSTTNIRLAASLIRLAFDPNAGARVAESESLQ